MTMMPPTKLVMDGASLKQTQTHPTASGVSSVLISAFSVQRPSTADGQEDQPQAELGCAEQKQLAHVSRAYANGVVNGQTSSGHSNADRHAAGSMASRDAGV